VPGPGFRVYKRQYVNYSVFFCVIIFDVKKKIDLIFMNKKNKKIILKIFCKILKFLSSR
jgi:hypothetical protein